MSTFTNDDDDDDDDDDDEYYVLMDLLYDIQPEYKSCSMRKS